VQGNDDNRTLKTKTVCRHCDITNKLLVKLEFLSKKFAKKQEPSWQVTVFPTMRATPRWVSQRHAHDCAMNADCLISVVIHCYNAAQVLPRATQSVMAQNTPGTELEMPHAGIVLGTCSLAAEPAQLNSASFLHFFCNHWPCDQYMSTM
jgi:hypothetical protein